MANLRGLPEDYSPITRPERSMDSILDRILQRYKIGVDSLEDRIRDNWTAIVGPANAQHCQPIRIERDRTLFIAVSNPIIRQELEFNKSLLLRNLHQIQDARKIRTLVFKAG